MPASTKFPWIVLLDAARRVRKRVGIRPPTNAVAKEAGGGSPRRIQQAITAVEVEYGHHLNLLDELPEDLRKLVNVPHADAPTGNPADFELPNGVRAGLAQVVAACSAALRDAFATAETRVVEATASATAEVDDMHRRLLEQDQDAEVERGEHAKTVADNERRAGALTTALATAEQEVVSRIRELDGAHADAERAREAECEARAQRDRTLEAHHALSERATADLAAAVAQAVRAEAERDAVKQSAARLEAELQRMGADKAATITGLSSRIDSLVVELKAARHSRQRAVAAHAASKARLKEVRAERDRLVAAGGR